MNKDKNKTFNTEEINNVTKSSGVIPAGDITTAQPTLNVPEVNMRETAPQANQSLAEAQGQVQEQTVLEEKTNQRIADTQAQRSEQQNLIKSLGSQGAEIQQMFDQGEEQLQPIEKEITDLTSLINSKTQAIQNQLIDEEGRRIPQAFITGRQAIIQQRGTAEVSALSGLLDAKNGQMQLAQNKLDRSLNIMREVNRAELAEKEARVSLLREITGESRAEEETEITRLKEEQAKYDKERDAISSIGLQAMQAGAGANEINAIVNAKTKDEAITAAKSLGTMAKLSQQNLRSRNYSESLKQTKLNAEIDSIRAEAEGVEYNPDKVHKIGTVDNTVAWMEKSSNNDKQLDQGQREKIGQINLALNSVEALNSVMFEGGDPLDSGRVRGRFDSFKRAIAEDADITEINAIVQGMIPTVARGIFGEVGVLTKDDIDNYKQTIPTINNTTEENKVVSLIMMDVLSNTLDSEFSIAAKSGQNVSNFTGEYIDKIDRIEKQKESIGVAEISKESNNNLFGSSINSNPQLLFDSASVGNAASGALDFLNNLQ